MQQCRWQAGLQSIQMVILTMGTTKGMHRDVRLAGDGIRSQNTGVCACHQCVWTSVAKQADDCS